MLKKVIARIPEEQRKKLRRRLNWLLLGRELWYDGTRFARHSSALRDPLAQGQQAAHLTMDYHRIEKGLALPSPRPGFGADVIARLLANLPAYQADFGEDDLVRTVRDVLRMYQMRQAALGHTNPGLDAFFAQEDVAAGARHDAPCGVVPVAAQDLFPFEVSQAETVLESRKSVRQFTGELVDDTTLRRIAELAQRAPSVCNRQCGRLYVANTREKIDRILAHQNGNRGFGQSLGAVFIVAADLQAFTSLGERNQGYVDGGIFAMETLAAIHTQKLGGCMLNWSATSGRDKALRAAFDIPPTDVVITMIGCGHPLDQVEVAASPRVSADHVLRPL